MNCKPHVRYENARVWDPSMGSGVLVIDTGVILRLKPINTLGSKAFCPASVLHEIRDSRAQEHFKQYGEWLQVRTPLKTDIARVTEAAEITGDARYLSSTDKDVLALSINVMRECGLTELLRTPQHPKFSQECMSQATSNDEFDSWIDVDRLASLSEGTCESSRTDGDGEDEGAHKIFSLITTDYSIQNVALQMGIPIANISGLSIRRTKQWITVCTACKYIEYDSGTLFCKKCAGSSFKRCELIVTPDGARVIENPRWKPRLRGTVYTMPHCGPQKHAGTPFIFAPDQLLEPKLQRQLRHEEKQRQKLLQEQVADLGQDGISDQFSFAQFGKSGAACLLKVGYGGGNPNVNSWRKRHTNKRRS